MAKRWILLSVVVVICSTIQLLASSRVLINGIHGNPHLFMDQAEDGLEEFQERFPEVEFHTINATDLPICRPLLEGTFSEGWHYFTVPEEESDLLSCIYLITFGFDTLDTYEYTQLPSNYLWDGEESYPSFECSIIVENPIPGEWALYVGDTYYPESYSVLVGLGPPLFQAFPIADFDLQLMLPSYTWYLFRGVPPGFGDLETAYLAEYFAGGGSLVIARQSGATVDKPVVRMYDITDPLHWHVDFPGRLTFGRPRLEEYTRTGSSSFTLSLGPQAQATILYEGVLEQRISPLTCSRSSHGFRLTNHGADLVHPCLIYRLQQNGNVRLLTYSPLQPDESVDKPVSDQLLSRSDWRQQLQELMWRSEIEYGMYEEEATSFEENWHWCDRLDEALSGEWQGLYLYHTGIYEQLIPLQGRAREETIRLLWHFDSPLDVNLPVELPFEPDYTQPILPCSVYHEYGIIWDHQFPEQLDQEYFAINFTDSRLRDTTDTCDNGWRIAYHTFNTTSPLAEQLLSGVEQLCGHRATSITGNGIELPVTGDDDTFDVDGFFPPGSFPPVVAIDYHGEGQVVGISDQGFLQDLGDNDQLLLNLFAALDNPGPGDEPWLLFDPPVQELFFATTTRSDIEFRAINMGSDSATVIQETPSVPWLEPAGVTPPILAPGDTALVEYSVLWDSPWLEDGEYDIELPLDPGEGAALVHAIVILEKVPPLPKQLRLVRAYPNPFNNITSLELDLTSSAVVDLAVFNQLGQFLMPLYGSYTLPAGSSQLSLDFSNYASGVYYYRLRFDMGDVYHGAVTLVQ